MRKHGNWLLYLVIGAVVFIGGALLVGVGVSVHSYSLIVLGMAILATGMTSLDVSYLHHGSGFTN
ncbi:hypothetical protein [Lacticaseibacillus hulanensis]|uniref:hypothetical protein n=1 Tax=Lacticaseibacillus hulanensis TaxID=2493111 RepID=UPI000FDA9D85|nr:hypothetical protein [Lacticaseibacillus hulanensis]